MREYFVVGITLSHKLKFFYLDGSFRCLRNMKKPLTGMFFFTLAVIILVNSVSAHDGWIQSNVARVTVGDKVYIDMLFGNHMNMHRDYLVHNSKWDVAKSTFTLHTPNGEAVDIEDDVINVGFDEVKILAGGAATYADKNGYLVSSFVASQKGIYIVDARQDTVVSYAPERSIKCAKSIVASTESSMKSNVKLTGFDKVVGQVIEIVPLKDPTALVVGDELPFMVLFKGEALPDAEVSVIPRGTVLPPMGTPNPNDFMTDMDGMASFIFTEANYHLIVVHLHTEESGILDGKSYSFTKYTADLTVIVSPPKPRDLGQINRENMAVAELTSSPLYMATLLGGQNMNSVYFWAAPFLAGFALACLIIRKKK